MTFQANDRLNLFLVWNITSIKSGVAGDADEVLVRRDVRSRFIHEERDLLSISFLRERCITMAGETINFGMAKEEW